MSFATTITSDARGVRVVVSRFQSTAPDVSINLRRLFKLAAGDYLTERYADASFNLYGPDCSPFCLVNSEQLLTADKLKFYCISHRKWTL